MPNDDWSSLLHTDMDKLLLGQEQQKKETIQLKKGERRNVTVLFLDIKGYTAMSEKLDPEEVTQIIDNVFKVLTGEIVRYGGMVDKYIGDCIMALFGARQAREDDAERAIRAALGMLGRMDQINVLLTRKEISLNCRIGINTGLVVAGELGGESKRDFTVMGDTVNTASRLESNAEPGTILISEGTRSQAGDIFDYQALEPLKVKGKVKPLKVYRVAGVLKDRVERWDRDTVAKSRTYVGREAEWRELEIHLKKMLPSSTGGTIPVIGVRADGGMGKSRMIYEFLRRGPCPRGMMLRGKTISYTSAPYWIFISLIKNLMGVQEGDPLETIRQKWEELLDRLKKFERAPEDKAEDYTAELTEIEEFLAFLLGVAKDSEKIKSIKPDKLKERFFSAFRIFLEAASALPDEGEACYFVLDDLHWIDELSRNLIDYLMDNLKPVRPTLFVAMFRPDFQQSDHWREGDNYHELQVMPLSYQEVTEMVEGMLPGLRLTQDLQNLIYDKSGGNAFFVEEISFALIEQEALVPDDQIQPGVRIWVVNQNMPEVDLPNTIHGMVQTRIDKLDEKVRNLLLEASVIGADFAVDLLKNLYAKAGGEDAQVPSLLEELERARMIVPRPAGVAPGETSQQSYVFSNVLIAEVCYETLLNYNKTVFHGLVGECLEERYPEGRIPEEEHMILAFHFEKGEKFDKAVPYLESSADQCATRFSNAAAIDYYQRLLKLLEKNPESSTEKDRLVLRNLYKLAEIEYRVARLDQAYDRFAECCKRSQALNDYDLLCQSLTNAGEIDRIRERPERARRFFDKSLEIAEKLGRDGYAADNLVNIGILMEESGDFAGAMSYFQQALGRAVTDEQRQIISHYIFERA